MQRLYQSSRAFRAGPGGQGWILKPRLPAKRQKLPLLRVNNGHSAQSSGSVRRSPVNSKNPLSMLQEEYLASAFEGENQNAGSDHGDAGPFA